MVSTERVDQVLPILPEQCQRCGNHLPRQLEQAQTIGVPQRRQVTELPPIRAHITEYQLHCVVCDRCGASTRAVLPPEIKGSFGPQLTALIAYLTVVCRMPRRVVEALLQQVLGVEMSLGSTQKCWEEASQAVALACQELEEHLKEEAVLNVDETGWRTNGDKRYLWAFVALQFVVYRVAATRGSEVLTRLLGAVFRGVLCSDRFSAYLKYHSGKAQFCWAHLKRNLLGIMDLTKNSAVERFCRDALAAHARLFRLWHKFRGGQIDRRQLLLRSLPIQQRIFALAEQHLDSSHREVRNLATALFKHNERLFTFLEQEGVETTVPNEPCAQECNGERSASGIAVPQASWPRLACSLWLKPVSCKTSISWLISLPQLPAIGDVSGQPHYYRVDQPELLRTNLIFLTVLIHVFGLGLIRHGTVTRMAL